MDSHVVTFTSLARMAEVLDEEFDTLLVREFRLCYEPLVKRLAEFRSAQGEVQDALAVVKRLAAKRG